MNDEELLALHARVVAAECGFEPRAPDDKQDLLSESMTAIPRLIAEKRALEKHRTNIAVALGVAHLADGHAPHAGPDDDVLAEVEHIVREAGKVFELEASIRELTEWRPMETAPRGTAFDKKPFLGRSTLVAHPVPWFWDEDNYARKPRPFWNSQALSMFGLVTIRKNQPTGWLPLPEVTS